MKIMPTVLASVIAIATLAGCKTEDLHPMGPPPTIVKEKIPPGLQGQLQGFFGRKAIAVVAIGESFEPIFAAAEGVSITPGGESSGGTRSEKASGLDSTLPSLISSAQAASCPVTKTYVFVNAAGEVRTITVTVSKPC